MDYLIEYSNGTNKATEVFDTLEDAVEFFKKAIARGYYVALYNMK